MIREQNSLSVYLTDHLLSPRRTTTKNLFLPPIDQTKKKKRVFRQSLFHQTQTNNVDSNYHDLAAFGSRRPILPSIRQREKLFENNLVPPSTPADDFFHDFYRTTSSPDQLDVPYRLPALKKDKGRRKIRLILPILPTNEINQID